MSKTKHTTVVTFAGLLAAVMILPATAAPRHHRQMAAESADPDYGLPPGDLPLTAGSNQGSSDNGFYYNRLYDY